MAVQLNHTLVGADPFKNRPSEWNTDDGGRGLYWEDPSGHMLEIITRPYGSGDQ